MPSARPKKSCRTCTILRRSARSQAKLSYTLNGDKKELDWTGEEGVAPFTYVGIFDSPAVQLHVDDDLAYIYTPGDLALFPHITESIQAMRSRLEQLVESRRPQANPYLSHFTRDTPAYTAVETLGAATDLDAVKKLAEVSDSDRERLQTLATQVAALQGDTVTAQLTVARSRRDLHAALSGVAETILGFDATAYVESVENATAADKESAELRHELVASLDLEPPAEEAWQAFVLRGEEYRAHVDEHYPSEDEACLYCRQPLSPEAVALVQKFGDFANDASRRRAADARGIATTICREILEADQASLRAKLTDARAEEENDAALDDAWRMLTDLHAQADLLREQKPQTAWDELRQIAEKVKADSVARRDAAAQLITSLTTKEGERTEELRKTTAHHDALKDRVQLSSRLAGIREYVENAQWTQRAEQLSARFTSILRSLTETAKTASSDLLNTDFEKRFEAECKALRAPKVGLEFPGRQGKAARRKTVSTSYRPSEILSEGEQKVIALADFLAEASLRLTPAPIVLDDPVSSLDYRRIQEVAARVTELAEQRQVVVFTHSIWFATELLARFEAKKSECSYFSVTDEDTGKGIITKGTHPRWDTIKQTRAKINDAISSASSSDGETREALVERGYSLIRAWCEIAVETELLAGVTQRYAPNVGMTKLSQIKGEHLSAAVQVILPIFEKACRIMEGHSQPLETLGVRASLDQLEADWKQLQESLRTYQDA